MGENIFQPVTNVTLALENNEVNIVSNKHNSLSNLYSLL